LSVIATTVVVVVVFFVLNEFPTFYCCVTHSKKRRVCVSASVCCAIWQNTRGEKKNEKWKILLKWKKNLHDKSFRINFSLVGFVFVIFSKKFCFVFLLLCWMNSALDKNVNCLFDPIAASRSEFKVKRNAKKSNYSKMSLGFLIFDFQKTFYVLFYLQGQHFYFYLSKHLR
jgi:hypothetical protein